MENTNHNATRVAGREHIPLYPKNFIALRIVQLVLAVIILGLAAYGVSGIAFDGDVFILVVALFTLIISTYYLVAEYSQPAIYNYWAVLGTDIFLVIMWLASFALLASEVGPFLSYTNSTYYDPYTGTYYHTGLDSVTKTWASVLAAAAGLGGLEFALFIGSLATHGIMLHRHRQAGLHAMPGVAASQPAGSNELKQQTYTTAVPAEGYAAPQTEQQQAYAVPAPGYQAGAYKQA